MSFLNLINTPEIKNPNFTHSNLSAIANYHDLN